MMKHNNIYQMDEMAYEDEVDPAVPRIRQRDEILKPDKPEEALVVMSPDEYYCGRGFEAFLLSLPSRLHRQVAWTRLYFHLSLSPAEFYMSSIALKALGQEVTTAYRLWMEKLYV